MRVRRDWFGNPSAAEKGLRTETAESAQGESCGKGDGGLLQSSAIMEEEQ